MKIGCEIYYSIIIPHKNIPDLLKRCLETIPKRNDVQVIVVDDNSDSRIIDFNNFPGLNLPNVEVYFTTEGKGAGYARNVGLSKAKGKWLVFADADDYYNDCFGEMLDKYKECDADLILFQTKSVYNDTLLEVESRGAKYNQWIRKSIESGKVDEHLKYKVNPPWGKFFSRKLINNYNIKFEEVYAGNDALFSTVSGHYSKVIKVDLNFIYCSTIRENSLQYTLNKDKLQSSFNVALRQYHFLLSVNKTKYRQEIIPKLLSLIKIDKARSFRVLLYCMYNMKFKHFVIDVFRMIFHKLKKQYINLLWRD